MNNTISGNYEVTDRELAIVEEIFNKNKVPYKSIEKHKKANDGDVLVTLADGSTVLIEVKEEDYETRFSKYEDIGIDLLSSFQFKKGVNPDNWKGIKKGSHIWEFFKQIDKNSPSYKEGKIGYSKSDLWLFFSAKRDGTVMYYSFFPGEFIKSNEFKRYLVNHCSFAVNNKPSNQMSYYDINHSAVFYINSKNSHLTSHAFDIRKLRKRGHDGLAGDGLADGGLGLE